MKVSGVMTRDVQSILPRRSLRACHPDDETGDVARLMGGMQNRRIPVVDGEGRLVGIVALGDLATDDTAEAAEALKQISEPSEPDRPGNLTQRRADRTRDHQEP